MTEDEWDDAVAAAAQAAEEAQKALDGRVSDTAEEMGYLFEECRKGLEQAWSSIRTAAKALTQAQVLLLGEPDTANDLRDIAKTLPDIEIAIDHIGALLETTVYDVEDTIADRDDFAAEIVE